MAVNEAAEYVDSIMSSQRMQRVGTPGRKRNRSDPTVADSNGSPARKSRVLSLNTRITNNVNRVGSGGTTEDDNTGLRELLSDLASDLNMQFAALNERMDKLENGLEQILDKRVTQEMNKIRNDVETKIDNIKRDIRAEVTADIDVLNDRINDVVNAQSLPRNNSEHDILLNVAIRKLPESASENIINKVNALIKDGLKVSGVECARAERKESRDSSKPGLVVVGFHSHNDKRKVMEKKSVLRDSQQYQGVYINHDKSLQERRMADNFRTILNSLNVDDLVMKGSRVMKGNKRTDGFHNNNRSSRDRHFSNNYRQERNSQSDRQGGNPNNGRRGLIYSNDRAGGNSDNDGQENRSYSDRRGGNNGRDMQENNGISGRRDGNSDRDVHENNRYSDRLVRNNDSSQNRGGWQRGGTGRGRSRGRGHHRGQNRNNH
ncbi:hypothetical protein DPMN_148303 [Dreissena polymorpha]|uniref:Uncharacterized protein n=1 Tax=Dreissena polymorpha TaxID=45954 RepID=A0A9D4J1E2_DREPO|nr:hypothetical protein DPMN_148303 [Dreissena polymorpha]